MLTFLSQKITPSPVHANNHAEALKAIEEVFQEDGGGVGGGVLFVVEYTVACGAEEPCPDTEAAVEKTRQENRTIVANIADDIKNITGYRWRSVYC
jgi:hypothetical protein